MGFSHGYRSLIASITFAALALVLTGSSGAAQGNVREFQVTAKKYEWTPARFEVNEGDTVRFIVHSSDSKHGFRIKELDVKQEVPKTGDTVTIELVASRPGEFEIACSEWCGKGHKSMKGVLVVKPRAAGTR
jgi:cytochrome c oxidase subunit 2